MVPGTLVAALGTDAQRAQILRVYETVTVGDTRVRAAG